MRPRVARWSSPACSSGCGRPSPAFVAAREARDRTLPMPKLILHALQVNTNGGRLPEPEANGRRYLKIPLDLLSAPWG